jgi:hypothetical protein
MCSICQDRGPDYKATPNEIAHEHGDDDPNCIRKYDEGDGSIMVMCIDCGEYRVKEDHCCYE